MARELYPNIKFNIVCYHPGDLDADGKNHTYLTAAVSLGGETKHLTPATECNKSSCYLDYDKALYKLFRKLVNELDDRRNGLSSKKIDLL